MPEEGESLVPPRVIAAAFGVDVRTVQHWRSIGRITAAIRTPGGQYRYYLSDVLKQAEEAGDPPPEESGA